MSNHLTPSQLAYETGMDREDVIACCMELGVPIFEGKIDKTLFASARKESERATTPSGTGQLAT